MYPGDYLAENDWAPESGRVFVLMPFGEEFDDVYASVREAVEGDRVCFRCVRADELYGGHNVMGEILEQITRAEIVLADVTGRNPNVFYELGIAHTVVPAPQVIVLTQDDADIPFDIRQYRYLHYETGPGLEALSGQLADTILEVAPKSITFEVRNEVGGRVEQKLFGPDRWLYSIGVPEAYVGDGFAKFRLVVNHSGLKPEPATLVHDGYWGLQVGEGLEVPGLGWALLLERVEGEIALFRLASEARDDLRRVD